MYAGAPGRIDLTVGLNSVNRVDSRQLGAAVAFGKCLCTLSRWSRHIAGAAQLTHRARRTHSEGGAANYAVTE